MGRFAKLLRFKNNKKKRRPAGELQLRPVLDLLEDRLLLATQIFTATPDQVAASNNRAVFDVVYTALDDSDTRDDNIKTTGAHVRMHYNSAHVTPDLTSITASAFAGATVQDLADTSDFDGDAATDRLVNFLWSDIQGMFPQGTTLPITLFTADFDAASNFNGTTQANFSGTTPPNFMFQAGPATLDFTVPPSSLITVTETGGNTMVAEAGATTDTYSIVLNSTPTDDVTISLAGATGDIMVMPTSLTFTPANASTPQTVTVQAVDDNLIEGTETVAVNHTVTSNDSSFNQAVISDVSVTVADDDTTGTMVNRTQVFTPTPAQLEVNNQAHFDVIYTALDTNAMPDNTVKTTGAHVRLHYNSSQAVPDVASITASAFAGATIQDSADTGDFDSDAATDRFVNFLWSDIQGMFPQGTTLPLQLFTADFDSASSFAGMTQFNLTGTTPAGFDFQSTPAQVEFGRMAAVTIAQTGGNTEVNEAGMTTDTYTLVLDTTPTDNVTVNLSPAGNGLTVMPTSLTFTPGNARTPQTVKVQAVDDSTNDGTEVIAINHTVASNDASYDQLNVDAVMATILDNETAGDRFNRSDANSLGSTWSAANGAYSIQNQRAVVTSASAVEATLDASAALETDGVAVEADIDFSTTPGHAGLIARASADRMNQYLGAIVFDNTFGSAQIWKRVNGVWTNLDFQFLPNSPRVGKLRLEVIESQIFLRLAGNIVALAFDNDLPASNPSDAAGLRGSGGVTYDNVNVEPITLTKVSLPDSDDFAGSDGSGLGAKWFQRFDRFTIQSNRAQAENILFGRSLATLNTTQKERNVVVEGDVALNTSVPLTHSGLIARYNGTLDDTMYLGALVYDANRPAGENFRAQIWVHDGTLFRNLVDNPVANANNGQGRLTFQVHDNSLRLQFTGMTVAATTDNTLSDAGSVGIRSVAGETIDSFSAAVSSTAPTVGGLTIVTGDFSENGGQITANLNSNLATDSSTAATSVAANVTLGTGVSAAGLILNYSGPGDDNWYWGTLVDTGTAVELQIFKMAGGAITQLATRLVNLGQSRSGQLSFSISGSTLSLQLGTEPALTVDDTNNPLAAGRGGIRGTPGTVFENVTIQP